MMKLLCKFATYHVLLGLLLLAVAIECDHRETEKDDEDEVEREWDWGSCDEHWQCEARDDWHGTGKPECCEGECKETCGSWVVAFLVILLGIACCFGCLAAIAGVVYFAAYAAHKNAKNDHPDPTVHTQSAPAYTMNAYGAPPAYGGDTAGPLPNKM